MSPSRNAHKTESGKPERHCVGHSDRRCGRSWAPRPPAQPLASVSFSIQSEVSFEGAYGNLKRLYDKAARMYRQLKKGEARKLSPSRKR